MLFSTLVEGFLLDCRTRNLSERTIGVYKNSLDMLGEYLGDCDAESITLSDLRGYSLHLQNRNKYGAGDHPWMEETEEKLSIWTVHGYLRPIKTLFRWCVDEGLLSADPAERLKLPLLPRGRVDRFTDEQIKTLLAACRDLSYRNYAIAFLLLDSGLRRSELVNLNLDDVDLTTGVVTIRHGKGDKWRQVRVGNACRKTLWVYVNRHRDPSGGDVNAFFVSNRGKRLTGNAIGCLLTRLSNDLEFSVYCHKFRHTFATNLAKQVPNAFLVAQALGHSDLNTAQIYVHLAQSELSEASPMDAMFGE
jgi:site-specific recombinase XerD